MFWIFPAVFAVSLVAAQYPNSNADSSLNSYPQPAADYPSQVVIPQPVYVPVPPPARLPNLPASHEFLKRRKHHHRRHRNSRSSSSSSEEHHKKCYRCKSLKNNCDGAANCYRPEISYLKCNGCKRAIISCPGKSDRVLRTIDGETLATGTGIQKVAKCHKNKWTAKDADGEEVDFKHVICMGGIV